MKEDIILCNDGIYVSNRTYEKKELSLLKDIYVEKGTLDDWKLLHELHYKAENLGIGPRFYRCVLDGLTIGVIVMTVPKILDSGRNMIFRHLRPNAGGRDTRMINQRRISWLNEHMILNSRQVIDTMYRGAGIAYRFRNLTHRLTGKRFVEMRSSMSRYNPFSAKAGARFVKPKASNCYEKGLQFFARNFKSIPYDQVAIIEEMATMPEASRLKAIQEMRDFYYRNSSMEKSGDNRMNGTSRVDGMEVSYLIKQTQQLVFGRTMYGVYENPDWGRKDIPLRLPLIAFDLQKTTETLRTDLLEEIKA